MLYEKKYFGNGQGNFDDVDFVVGPNQWINLENARVGSTDKGVIGTVESVGSNVLLSSIQPSVNYLCVGAIEDPDNRQIFYFLDGLNGTPDRIMCYDLPTGNFYTVLSATDVIDDLNFAGTHLIHSARIINGLLYWTDNTLPPRRINIKAAINLYHPGTYPDVAAYTSPLNQEVISLIRRPPGLTLGIQKIVDTSIETNQIKNNAFYFAYQYVYRDGEISTVSARSLLAPYNYPGESFNAIQLMVPFGEHIYQDVQIINVIVIYALGGNGFIIKTWNKANATDAAEIADHVAGTAPLTFVFANDAVGNAIDSPSLAKPYDSVPLLSETLEQGVNRLFLGRNLVGYDTPTNTSLTSAIVQQDSEVGVSGRWVNVAWSEAGGGSYNGYIAYFPTPIDATHPAGFYDFTANPLLQYLAPPFPTEIDIDDYTFISDPSTQAGDLYLSEFYIPGVLGFPTGAGTSTYDLNTGDGVVTSNTIINGNVPILKSDSSYRLGIVFYDQYLRQCGVIEAPNNKITTPDRAYTQSTVYDYGIQWTLTSGPLPNEIPNWAIFYSIVVTKSLRTSFFEQARAAVVIYVTKDSDGNYAFSETSYDETRAGIGLNLAILNGYGLGYSFQDGDIVKVYMPGDPNVYSLSVLDQFGEWVIAELVDLGSLFAANAFFEIYTPTPQNASELYYEIGNLYYIVNPTIPTRAYSVTTGFIPGDVYLLSRGTSPGDYLTENMSPNDTLWRNWFTNAGRVQIIDTIGQRQKDTSVKWSNTFIPGSITNGLSTFDALDEKILPGQMGALRKLQITSKVNNEQGAVMLGICESETASIYLGETQLVASAANAFIAQSSGVIGTINILKGSFGTINPESISEFRGNVYWVDVLNGKAIQYSLNGLFPISNYKMSRFWQLFCDQYASMSYADIDALGNRPYIFTTVDPKHWELLISVPRVLANPPKGFLPDSPYTSYVYPFDIWDGQGKTLVYKINAEPNYWQGAYNINPEAWVTLENRLFSIKNGQLYEHNDTNSYANFYGLQYKSRIMHLANQQPERDKVYNNMSLAVNMLPTLTYFMSLSPNMQVSNLQDFDWEQRESMLYSQIYRNVLTPTATGLLPNALVTGEKMRTYAFRVMLEFTVSTTPLELRFATLGYQISLGHSIPIQ